MNGKLTQTFGQKTVPEVAGARNGSEGLVDCVAVLEPEAGIARGVGNELVAVDVVDRPAVLQLGQVRAPGTNCCTPRRKTKLIIFLSLGYTRNSAVADKPRGAFVQMQWRG